MQTETSHSLSKMCRMIAVLGRSMDHTRKQCSNTFEDVQPSFPMFTLLLPTTPLPGRCGSQHIQSINIQQLLSSSCTRHDLTFGLC